MLAKIGIFINKVSSNQAPPNAEAPINSLTHAFLPIVYPPKLLFLQTISKPFYNRVKEIIY